MKLIHAIANFLRGKDQEAADALADPVRDTKFAIEDSEEKVREFTSKIADVTAEARRFKSKVEQIDERLETLDRTIRSAASAGNREDVAKLVASKHDLATQRAANAEQVEHCAVLQEKLMKSLHEMQARIEKAKSGVEIASAEVAGAKLRQEMANADLGFNEENDPLSGLTQAQEAADKESARAEALEQIANSTPEKAEADLLEKYSSSDADVQAEVDAVMAAAGKS